MAGKQVWERETVPLSGGEQHTEPFNVTLLTKSSEHTPTQQMKRAADQQRGRKSVSV